MKFLLLLLLGVFVLAPFSSERIKYKREFFRKEAHVTGFIKELEERSK